MLEEKTKLILPMGQYLLTRNPEGFYTLETGAVNVYVTRVWGDRILGEPRFVCRVCDKDRSKGIPGMLYTEETGEQFSLMLCPEGSDAGLSVYSQKNTSVSWKKFLKKCDIPAPEDWNFAGALAALLSAPERSAPAEKAEEQNVPAGEAEEQNVPAGEAEEQNVPAGEAEEQDASAEEAEEQSVPAEEAEEQNVPAEEAEEQNVSAGEAKLQTAEEPERIVLTSTEEYLTGNAEDAFRVEEGAALIYITTLKNGRPQKLLLYHRAEPGEAFPALACRDGYYQNWRLVLRSNGDRTVLRRLPGGADEPLRKEFLLRENLDTYDREGYENSLIECYTAYITLGENAFIERSRKSGEQAQKQVKKVLTDPFRRDSTPGITGEGWYPALSFVCGRLGIPLPTLEELNIRCGKDAGLMDIARVSGFICRKVVLDADWFEKDCGGLVGTLDGEPIAVAADKWGRCQLCHAKEGTVERLTPELGKKISPEAYSIGRTLPTKPLKRKDVLRFCRRSIRPGDLVPYIVLVLLCSLIGVLLPTLNGMIYDDYIPMGSAGNLVQLCVVMLSFMIGNISFSVVRNLFGYRITSRVGNDLQNAVYHRLFHLPESFFRDYDSADLAGRISGIGATAAGYANTMVLSSISALFSLVYLFRMLSYSKGLTWVGLGIYLVYLIFSTVITAASYRGQAKIAQAESESRGKLYQYLNGVDKLRMAGVEERALLSYMRPFAKQQAETIRVNRLVSVQEALATVIKSLFSMLLYWYIVKKLSSGSITIGSFVAFNSAFGAFTGALDSLVAEALQLLQGRSELKRFWPVFDAVPEDDESKEMPGRLSGELTLDHVTFSYGEAEKKVLNDLSLHIKSGEYVGIVGPSGCGKSTLLKLLLGFETPQSGMVLADKKDLRTLNKGAYRRQLGVVLQSGRLISGSIYDNITITAPDATMARVNEVVEQVGLKDDIAQMPMGLHTMLSENCNTISGGQQQRILIARAICGSPRILIFDEATSALDNVTQKKVSDSLDGLKVTRVVVAHRLSTIMNCDRILVLDGGRIVQEGSYKKLMEDKNGMFYALASRQIAQ